MVPPPPLRGRPVSGTIIMSEAAYERYMRNALPLGGFVSRSNGNTLRQYSVPRSIGVPISIRLPLE
jgi:hypothetical protein